MAQTPLCGFLDGGVPFSTTSFGRQIDLLSAAPSGGWAAGRLRGGGRVGTGAMLEAPWSVLGAMGAMLGVTSDTPVAHEA